jgi:hypothetical protein
VFQKEKNRRLLYPAGGVGSKISGDKVLFHSLSELPQCVDGSCQIRRLHQEIVGVERGNGKHADARIGQWLNERGQDADRHEGNRTSQLQASPVLLASDAIGDKRLQAEIESSSDVRVMEKKVPVDGHAGMAASASSLQMA